MTYGELMMMDEARDREAWKDRSWHTAVIVNSNPFGSGKKVSPDDFNPYASKSSGPSGDVVRVSFKDVLKAIPFGSPSPKRNGNRRIGEAVGGRQPQGDGVGGKSPPAIP